MCVSGFMMRHVLCSVYACNMPATCLQHACNMPATCLQHACNMDDAICSVYAFEVLLMRECLECADICRKQTYACAVCIVYETYVSSALDGDEWCGVGV
jgi:hypothetical protein